MVEVDGKSDYHDSLNKDFGSTKHSLSDFFLNINLILHRWLSVNEGTYLSWSVKEVQKRTGEC